MLKKKKAVIAVAVSLCLVVLAVFICDFLVTTVSDNKIADQAGNIALYTQIVDGADYGCNFQKYKIETSADGESYITFYSEAPFGVIKSTGRYYQGDANRINDEIGYSFSSMTSDYSEYAYVFYGNNSQQAVSFEISIDNIGTVSREIDAVNPFVCVFTDRDFNCNESVVHLEKTVRLIDSNDNIVLEQVI